MTIAVPAGGIPAKLRLHQAKNMIGAGLLSLPWTMEQASLGPGIAAMVIMAFLNGASLMLLALSCHLTNLFSYNAIGAYCFGPQIGRFMQAVVGLYAFGSCVTYAVLVGE
jgi:amino acid permease